jgi:hypothetical protein
LCLLGTEHSGILLFKVILAKSQVDTRATIALLMGKLTTGMTNIMASHSNNITEFNAEVMETIRKLQSRGKGGSTEIDLLPQLFVAYASCGSSDTPFVTEYRKGSRYSTEIGMLALVETPRSERIASEMLTSAMLTSDVLASAFPAEQEMCLPP